MGELEVSKIMADDNRIAQLNSRSAKKGKAPTPSDLGLSTCSDRASGNIDGDDDVTDVESAYSSRPSSPPVISIHYTSKSSGWTFNACL